MSKYRLTTHYVDGRAENESVPVQTLKAAREGAVELREYWPRDLVTCVILVGPKTYEVYR